MKKNILISGASGNLGKDVVNALHNKGYNLSLCVDAHLATMYDDLLNTQSAVVNLLDEAAAEQFVDTAINKNSTIDAAILLVGAYAHGNILETTDADIKKMMELNFLTALHLVKPLLRQYQKQGFGQFVFVGAKAAIIPTMGSANFAYALSKKMLFQLAEMINADAAYPNISAAVVVPSTMDTAATRAATPNADFSKWVTTKHVAENILFILSEAGSNLKETVLKIYNQS
jgi:short-subunit dehydrogenase